MRARGRLLHFLAATGAWLTMAAEVVAQSQASAGFPMKPIRLVLGFPAGGGADTVARVFIPGMEKALGQPIIIDYRPGAGGTVATDQVARASPDGYMLHYADSGPLTVVPASRKLGYDPETAFTPISLVLEGGYVVVAHPSVGAASIGELVGMARARPGVLSYGSSGTGSSGHLAIELLKAMASIDLVHIAYKGGAQSMTDLVGGQIPLLVASLPTAVPQIRAGKIKALGVTSTRRAFALAEVPSIAEQGFSGYDASVWFALIGPAGMPADIVARVRNALLSSLDEFTVREAIRTQGYDVSTSTPSELNGRIRSELGKWRKLIADTGLRME